MSDNDDLIKRSDVYKAVDDWFAGRVSNLNIKDIPSADRPQRVCEHGEYCMCATCHYREDCSYCADCTEAQKQMHDLWSCTKYMRKEHLRKGADDEHCIPSQFNKQIEDECAKEYEELGLKELKELIEADRKTESSSEKPNNHKEGE